jgi:glutathione S-transferase
MKLYSGPLSLFTAKVRIALDEKGIDYELVSVPFSRARAYEPKHPDVLAMNPKAQVPVLVDGDLQLYDSTIILEYLEERNPDPPLYPRGDIKMRARCRQAEAAADEVFFPQVWALIEEVFYRPNAAAHDAARIADATAAIHRSYRELDARLDGRPFLLDQFTVADIGYFLVTMFATNLGVAPGAGHGNVAAWVDRMLARPSVRREAEAMTAAAAAL